MKFPAFDPIDLRNNAQSLETIDLSLSKIIPDRNQPRKNFRKNSLEELASSIKLHGMIQPIIVRNIDEGKKYQIIAGERRWRAAKIAGLEKIPAIIKDGDKTNRMAISLIENIQRENLNPLEEAEAIQSLLEEYAMTHYQVAESIGKSRTTVSNLLRLLALTAEVKIMINSGLLEMGHARALLSLTAEQQLETAKVVIDRTLSVRETEKLVQRINLPQKKQSICLDSALKRKMTSWKTHLSSKLSSKVNIHFHAEEKGKIIIYFDSAEEADWLIEHIGFTAIHDVE